MHVLGALGVKDQIAAAAFEPQNAVTRHYKTGRAELTLPLKGVHEVRYGQPYFHIHRADLHSILKRAAEEAGAIFHLGAAVESVEQDNGCVSITAGGKVYHGDVLIGADGIHSAVRSALFGEKPARFTGQVAWRGTVETARLPGGLIPPDANAWLGPGRHFVSYYVRGGELVNFVAIEERETWAEESWNLEGDIGDVRAAFSGWDPRIDKLLSVCSRCYLWGLFDRPSMPHWAADRAALLGDACHPMLPFMAQGAAMAIEDAYVLAQCLDRAGASIPEKLAVYEAARIPRTARLQSISRENAEMFHLKPPAARALRKAKFSAASRVSALAHLKFDRIYEYNVTAEKV